MQFPTRQTFQIRFGDLTRTRKTKPRHVAAMNHVMILLSVNAGLRAGEITEINFGFAKAS
jgi:hypothetical protein